MDFRELVIRALESNLVESSDGCVITIKVEEDPSENYLTVEGGDIIFKTTSAGDAGRSNAALVGYLSRVLKIPSSKIDIVYGARSSIKRVLIKDALCDDLAQKLQRVIKFV